MRNAQALAAIPLVIAAGAALGYWKAKPVDVRSDYEGGLMRWADIETEGGLRFSISGGAWNEPGKLSFRVASIVQDGIRTHPRHSSIEAQADATKRTPESVAKDFYRRVAGSPEGIAQATQVRDDWQKQADTGAALRGVLADLAVLGYHINANRPPNPDAHSAPVWNSHAGVLPFLDACSTGHVTIDRLSIPVGKLAALRALLSERS